MSSKSLFNQKTLANIKKIHKGFLWCTAGVLIVSLLLGAVVIFLDSKSDVFVKVQGTFAILALAAFICINNFIRMEKGDKVIQGFALTGFFANIIWLVLGILMIWGVLSPVEIKTSSYRMDNEAVRTYDRYERYNSDVLDTTNVVDEYEYDDYDYDYDDYNYNYDYDYDHGYSTIAPRSRETTTIEISIATKILIVVVGLAAIGFWVSNILAIKNRVKAVMALKVAAVICQVFSSVFIMIMAFIWPIDINQGLLKWVSLYGLTSSGFVVMALAAWIISITHKDFDLVSENGVGRKNDLTGGANIIEATNLNDNERVEKNEVELTGGKDEEDSIEPVDEKIEEKIITIESVDDAAEDAVSGNDALVEEENQEKVGGSQPDFESHEELKDDSDFEGFSDNSSNY